MGGRGGGQGVRSSNCNNKVIPAKKHAGTTSQNWTSYVPKSEKPNTILIRIYGRTRVGEGTLGFGKDLLKLWDSLIELSDGLLGIEVRFRFGNVNEFLVWKAYWNYSVLS